MRMSLSNIYNKKSVVRSFLHFRQTNELNLLLLLEAECLAAGEAAAEEANAHRC